MRVTYLAFRAWDSLRSEMTVLPSTILAVMGRPLVKKPLAVLATLSTMAGIWWFALRPRFRKRS
jgi:hypothetical protein